MVRDGGLWLLLRRVPHVLPRERTASAAASAVASNGSSTSAAAKPSRTAARRGWQGDSAHATGAAYALSAALLLRAAASALVHSSACEHAGELHAAGRSAAAHSSAHSSAAARGQRAGISAARRRPERALCGTARSKQQACTATRQQGSAHTLLQMHRRHASSRSRTRELLQRLASARAPLALESQMCASQRRACPAPHPSRALACAHAPDGGSGAARQPAVHTRARRQRVTPGCVPPASKTTNDSSPDARLPGARAPSPRLSSAWRAHASHATECPVLPVWGVMSGVERVFVHRASVLRLSASRQRQRAQTARAQSGQPLVRRGSNIA